MIDALPLLLAPEGYQISRSVRLRSSANAYFSRTFAASSGTTDTFSFCVKRGRLGAAQSIFDTSNGSTTSFGVFFNAADSLEFYDYSSAYRLRLVTTQVFRDPSAWYHIVCQLNTTNATSANRAKIFVNGVEVTAFSTATYPTQNTSLNIGGLQAFGIGIVGNAGGQNLDGYLTEINFIDGQALTPAAFGETDAVTGVWKPKKYTGTYGTNGFYLNFSDNSAATAAAIGKDYSGNGNNWTPNNISVTAGVTYDSMLDVPTLWADGGNGRGNYATLNPLFLNTEVSATLSNGNLTMTSTTATNGVGGQKMSSILVSSGKWYAEVLLVNGGANYQYLGVQNSSGSIYAILGIASITNSAIINGSSGNQTGLGFATNGDVIGISLDADAGVVRFFKNNVQIGSNQSIATGVDLGFLVSAYHSSGTCATHTNFGQRPFAYTPPTGFKALNTQNLPDATIKKGNQYFDATTYTGNGTSQNVLTPSGFQPDLVWFKSRNNAASHVLFDSVRGANQGLYSNLTIAEGTWSGQSFLSNGFTVNATYSGEDNTNGNTYVGWQWKEGATQGFDIVTLTGTGGVQNISHSLGAAPKMMIFKSRNNVSGWSVYHASIGNTGALNLQATTATSTSIDWWNNTSPTSSQLTIGANINISGWTWIAYLFAEVAGFSKFGSYTGNGSADGPFVFCGFRPRYVLIKSTTDATASWLVFDSARNAYNVTDLNLRPNASDAESSQAANYIDFLSNGFKIRGTSTGSLNASSAGYIFAVFAEVPFKAALAR